MAIDIVLDPPRRLVLRRIRETIRGLLGGIVFLVGIAASIPAVVLTLLTFGIIAENFEPPERRTEALSGLPTELVLWGWIASIIVTTAGLGLGGSIIRGNRRLVLFLRRFRVSAATQVVTYAAATSIGRTWRLVTLDDAMTDALGVPDATLRWVHLARGAGGVSSGSMRLFEFAGRVGGICFGGLWVIVFVDALRRPNWPDALVRSAARFLGPVSETVQAGHLVGPLGADLQSAFLVLAFASAILIIVGFLGALLAVAASILLAAPAIIVGESLDRAEEAHTKMWRRIDHVSQAPLVTKALRADSRGIFSPRLYVVRVVDEAWRDVVERLAESSAAVIIDVSQPSENLIWEVTALKDRLGSTVVLVGELSRLQALSEIAGPTSEAEHRLAFIGASRSPSAEAMDRRLARVLNGRSVLAYTTDRTGRRRFARALRDRLETLAYGRETAAIDNTATTAG